MQCTVKSTTGRITEEYNFILTIVLEENNMKMMRFIKNLVLQFYCPPCLSLASEIGADVLALAQILFKMIKQHRVCIVLRRQ